MYNHLNYRIDECFARCLFTTDFLDLSKFIVKSLASPKMAKRNLYFDNDLSTPLLPVINVMDANTMALYYQRNGRMLPAITIYRQLMIYQVGRFTPDMKVMSDKHNNKHYNQFKELFANLLASNPRRLSREFEVMFNIVDYFRSQHARFELSPPVLTGPNMISIDVKAVDGNFAILFRLDELVSF